MSTETYLDIIEVDNLMMTLPLDPMRAFIQEMGPASYKEWVDFMMLKFLCLEYNVTSEQLKGSPAGEDGHDHRLIKRVVGVEGDVIQVKEGRLYRNNKEIDDGFERMENAGIAKEPIIVKHGELFVLGDNRNNSYDSRKIGLVKIKDVTNIVKGNLLSFWKDKK